MATRKTQGPMLRAVNKAIRGMHWLTEADEAAVAQVRQYARLIDEAVETDDVAGVRKTAGWLGPHLTGLLKQLGGTPEGRKSLAVEEKRVKGRLAELRAVRDAQQSA
jgi:hypothetical protein